MAVAKVLFKDEAGNNEAAVEWDTDEWVAFCDVDESCDWTWRDVDLGSACDVTAGHLALHEKALV